VKNTKLSISIVSRYLGNHCSLGDYFPPVVILRLCCLQNYSCQSELSFSTSVVEIIDSSSMNDITNVIHNYAVLRAILLFTA
jgi:hypothetical protein